MYVVSDSQSHLIDISRDENRKLDTQRDMQVCQTNPETRVNSMTCTPLTPYPILVMICVDD